MAVNIKGKFKKLNCCVKTMMPLDWGSINSTQTQSMDFKPISLTDTGPSKRMDFGWINPAQTT